MSLVRFDPFRQVSRIQHTMNRLFDESFTRDWEDSDLYGGNWTPAVDILETENELLVKAELPGLNVKDVDLRIENNVLTLKGKRELEKVDKKENFHRRERFYGTFVRSFTLPSNVDQEKVTAEFTDGVLEVRLPIKEESKPKQISVKVK